MPGGDGDPAAQSLATQMKDVHPRRSPRPGSCDRHVAGLAQQLALPHRDCCDALNSARRQLRSRPLRAGPDQPHARRALLWHLRHLEAARRRPSSAPRETLCRQRSSNPFHHLRGSLVSIAADVGWIKPRWRG